MSKKPANDSPPPNNAILSNLWAEAMRVYTEDKGAEDRARGNTKRHQLAFESQGIDAKTVRERFKENEMSKEERSELFAREQVSRRALSLFDAESPEDFNRLMERASKTPAADPEKLDAIDGERAYSAGFNGGAHGDLTAEDNKHVPGTVQHMQWACGVSDGIAYRDNLNGQPLNRTAPAMQEADAAPLADKIAAAKKKAGRPHKAPAAELARDVATIVDEELDRIPDGGLFADEMPGMAEMPE